MRKIFLSTMLLAAINPEDPTYYESDDFVLCDTQYNFPISYVIDGCVEPGDTVVIITAVEQNEDGKQNNAVINYGMYQKEVQEILKNRNVLLQFEEIPLYKDFDSSTFNTFFKQVSALIQDEDILYTDITFGMKPYSISMFVAIAYAAKAAHDVRVDTVIYAQKYSGFSRAKTAEEKAKDPTKSKIYDITSLFYLNVIAGNAAAGQKAGLDHLLNFIIDEE